MNQNSRNFVLTTESANGPTKRVKLINRSLKEVFAAGIEAKSPKCACMCAVGLVADSPVVRLAPAALNCLLHIAYCQLIQIGADRF